MQRLRGVRNRKVRTCMQVFFSGGGLKKHKKEWVSERGKGGKLINRALMSGLLLQVTEAQPCWGPLRTYGTCPRTIQ